MNANADHPQAVLERLLSGNRQWTQFGTRRSASLAPETAPRLAVVIACSDQHPPPERLFDVRFGDFLVAQTPGPFVGESVIATVQFGVRLLGIRLILVLAHEGCVLLDMPSEHSSALPRTGIERMAVRVKEDARRVGENVARRQAIQQAGRVLQLADLPSDVLIVPAVSTHARTVELL